MSVAGGVEGRERDGPMKTGGERGNEEERHDEWQPDPEDGVRLVSEETEDTVDQPCSRVTGEPGNLIDRQEPR